MTISILLIGVLLDLLIGDPYCFPHPVKMMGSIIIWEEKQIRKRCTTKIQLRFAGAFMVLFNLCIGYFIGYILLQYTLGFIKNLLSIYIVYTCISARMLHVEAYKVKDALKVSLNAARNQVGSIVGRDTSQLSEEEIIKATIETVAENTSDGIIAPLFYLLLLGIPGGILYKFVNTMDSMVGYRNDKYIDLGRYAAIVDDVFNFIPARITGFLFVMISFFYGRGKEAYQVMKRDHGKHLSPNAGYPEAAIAGMLGIKLGGGHIYFGKFVDKPFIGNETRMPNEVDIQKTVHCMYAVEGLFVLVMALFLM